MSDRLAAICEAKRGHVASRRVAWPLRELEPAARAAGPTRGFVNALRARLGAGGVGLIAEIKRASPSRGLIRAEFDPRALALAYADGGAACLSVLTDIPYFLGADEHLVAARAAVGLPVLRKDFVIDPYQVVEARALGADAVLLIMAALDDRQAAALEAVALWLDLDVLLEVHDEAELERALRLRSPLIGINNRDLKSFTVDLGVTERLARLVPADRLVVCESGIASADDIARVAAAGVRCLLVGESLMRQPDVATATRTLLGDPVGRAALRPRPATPVGAPP